MRKLIQALRARFEGVVKTTPRRAALYLGISALVWSIGPMVASHLGLSLFLEHRVVKALEFRTRAMLGRSTEIDPTLKAYAYDDNTAAMIGGIRLSVEDWLGVFEALAARKPRAIIIDGMFSSNQDVTPEQETRIRALANLPSPITVGSLVTAVPIKYRIPVPTERFRTAWTSLTPPLLTAHGMPGAQVYGPTPLFQEGFRQIGHIVQEWPSRFAPVLRLGPEVAVPHVALYAATRRELGPDAIRTDGTPIPVDADGLAAIDFLPPMTAVKRVKTLRGVIEKARAGKAIEAVNEGDTVLIINNYSTGNTDILDSPFGPIPGGYIIMSLINGVLRSQWIARLATDEPFIVAFAVVGTVIGALSPSFVFWIVMALGITLHVTLSLASFAFLSLTVPWLFPLTAFAGAGMTAYARQRSIESIRRMQLEVEVATASILQRQFFPEDTKKAAKFDIAAFYRPADSVGGDWYGYRIIGGRYLHVHLGDVTGHGTPAALLASFAKGATDMFYDEAERRGETGVALGHLHHSLNSMLRAQRGELVLMTLFSLSIDLETGACRFINSGHRPAFVAGGTGSTLSVLTRAGSTILGHDVLPPTAVESEPVMLSGVETILIISDGMIDTPTAMGIKVNERVLRKIARDLGGKSAEEARAEIVTRLGLDQPRPAGVRVPDDVTFIVLQLKLGLTMKRERQRIA